MSFHRRTDRLTLSVCKKVVVIMKQKTSDIYIVPYIFLAENITTERDHRNSEKDVDVL